MAEDNEIQANLAELMAQMLENVRPAVEGASGFKKQLEDEGWSPTIAEICAMELLQGVIRSLFK